MENKTHCERAVMLGLLTLLGATGTLYTAVAAAVTATAAMVAVGLADRILGGRSEMRTAWSGAARWGVLVTLSFAVTWTCAAVAPFTVPITDAAVTVLQLTGLTPIAFVALARPAAGREAASIGGTFLVLMLATGAVRELFGYGTLAGTLGPAGFTTPSALFRTPVGAFLIAGAIILAARYGAQRRAARAEVPS